jgi:diguanylate cyclase (GGDEF)-like protein
VGAGVAATVPFDPRAPGGFLGGLSACSAALGVAVYLAGHRLGRHAVHVLLVVVTVMIGTGVAAAPTLGGAMVAGYAYFWVGIYAAHFLPRRHALGHAASVALSFAVALRVGGFTSLAAWTIVTMSVVAATAVLSTLVHRLNERATTDHLTGLLNRHGLRHMAARELAMAERTERAVAVAIVDLDGFKSVNDSEGHAAGDRILRELASSWRAGLRASDIVAREGGDEFVFLFPATTEEQAATVLERLAGTSPISWTSGVTQWRRGETFDTCLERADLALYEAKTRRLAPAGNAPANRVPAVGWRSGPRVGTGSSRGAGQVVAGMWGAPSRTRRRDCGSETGARWKPGRDARALPGDQHSAM